MCSSFEEFFFTSLLSQILGVPDQAEKDEIVKSVMHLRNAQIEEGYTSDVVVSRQVWGVVLL